MIIELNDGKEYMKLAVERDNTSKVIFVDTRKISFGKAWDVAYLNLIYEYIYIRQQD